MANEAVILRGRLRGRVIELDEPAVDVAEGDVEVRVRSLAPGGVIATTPRLPDLLEVIASLPEGRRSKAEIDQQLGEDRTSWVGRG